MIYLDNGATTPVHERIKSVVIDMLSNTIGNPSSLHQLGLEAEKRIKEARFQVAKLFGAKEKNVIFGGRLAEYKYYDMDKVIESALNMVKRDLR